MKKALFIGLLIVCLVCTTFAFVACDEDVPVKLSTPTITLTDKVISWEEVEFATSYEVFRNNTSVVIQKGTTYTVADTAEGSYAYHIVAIAGEGYVKSDKSNAVNYVVEGTGQPTPTPTPQWSLSSILVDATLGFKFQATVNENYDTNMHQLVDDHKGDTHNSLKISYENTGDKTLFIKGKVEFSGCDADHAGTDEALYPKYGELTLAPGATGTMLIDVADIDANKIFVFPDLGTQDEAGEASFKITYCEFVNVSKVDAPVITLDVDTISWTAVDNATGYQIYRDDLAVGEVTTALSYTALDTEEGSYKYSVVAVSTEDGYADSDQSNVVTYVVGTPAMSIGAWKTQETAGVTLTEANDITIVAYDFGGDAPAGSYKNVFVEIANFDKSKTTAILVFKNTSDSDMHLQISIDDNGTDYANYASFGKVIPAGETVEYRADGILVDEFTPTHIKVFPDTSATDGVNNGLKTAGTFEIISVDFYTPEEAPKPAGLLGEWTLGNVVADATLGYTFTATVGANNYDINMFATVNGHKGADNNRIKLAITNTGDKDLFIKGKVEFAGSTDATAKYGELTITAGDSDIMYINVDDIDATKLWLFPDMGAQTAEGTASFDITEVAQFNDIPADPTPTGPVFGEWTGMTADDTLGYTFTATVDANNYGINLSTTITGHKVTEWAKLKMTFVNTGDKALTFTVKIYAVVDGNEIVGYGSLTLEAGETGDMYINIITTDGTNVTFDATDIMIFPDMGAQTAAGTASFKITAIEFYND